MTYLARQKAPIYNDNWVDYKQLKKLIKTISRAPETESKIEAGHLFFVELKTTLTKINAFYVGRETELQGRYDSLVKLDLNDAGNFKVFVVFYDDLMFLKSWATTNAIAFDKITKKHDKKTGYVRVCTRVCMYVCMYYVCMYVGVFIRRQIRLGVRWGVRCAIVKLRSSKKVVVLEYILCMC